MNLMYIYMYIYQRKGATEMPLLFTIIRNTEHGHTTQGQFIGLPRFFSTLFDFHTFPYQDKEKDKPVNCWRNPGQPLGESIHFHAFRGR